METGIIIKGVGGFYDVAVGNQVICCKAKGKFRKDNIIPMVGDYVRISTEDQLIEEILPRKNQLIRPAVSNIDRLAIVIALRQPRPDFLLVDKLMISAEYNDIKPILIINKTDLSREEDLNHIIDMYRNTGYTIVRISCYHGTGMDELKEILNEGITTFAGQSGVGKSSIIKFLRPDIEIETGSLSQRIERGKHTTRHVELMALPMGGMVVDTPGFSTIDIGQLTPEDLQQYYPDFLSYSKECRYSGCIHYHEPQCRVKEKIKDGFISRERYTRYLRILEETKERGRDVW